MVNFGADNEKTHLRILAILVGFRRPQGLTNALQRAKLNMTKLSAALWRRMSKTRR